MRKRSPYKSLFLDDGTKLWVNTEPKYVEDYSNYMNEINQIIFYEKELAEKAKELAEKDALLKAKEDEVEQLRRELTAKEAAVKAKDLPEKIIPSKVVEPPSETHERETLLIESTFDRERRIKKEKLNSLLKQNAENLSYLNSSLEWLEVSPHKRRKSKAKILRTKEEIAKARAEIDELRQQLENLEDNHEDTNPDPP